VGTIVSDLGEFAFTQANPSQLHISLAWMRLQKILNLIKDKKKVAEYEEKKEQPR
jgi:hypothetical protein